LIDDPTQALPPDSPAAFSLERGRSLRAATPRRSHADWAPTPDRRDSIDILASSNEGRIS
jgi:hypothetical protein